MRQAMDEVGVRHWSDNIGDLLFRCERKSISSSELIIELYDLIASGPAHICGQIRAEVSRSTLERLLDAGAFESAALRLLTKCGYMLSANAEGVVVATIALPVTGQEHSYCASSGEFALCGALAMSLQECV
jgi:hypothetical protein